MGLTDNMFRPTPVRWIVPDHTPVLAWCYECGNQMALLNGDLWTSIYERCPECQGMTDAVLCDPRDFRALPYRHAEA